MSLKTFLGIKNKKSELDIFNEKTKNKIYSQEVALASIKGSNINVSPHTMVDSQSCIGSYTYIGSYCTVTKSTIGKYCSVGNNVSIGIGEHDLSKISTSSYFYASAYDLLTSKECIIGNDVWVGVDSIIRRGVKIGNGVIIGANSFVNKDIPDYAIVVGSPAKIIKYRFKPEQISIIINSKWWEFELEEAKKILEKLEYQINKTGD